MKRKLKALTIAALSLFCTGGCDWTPQAKQRRIEAENDRRWEGAVVALAKKHNAVSEWESKLPKRVAWGAPFSLEVSRALIQSNGQPVLLVMWLHDVCEKDGSYSAVFLKQHFTNHVFRLFVEVKCSREQANQLLHTGEGAFHRYAVVARLEGVSRSYFKLSGKWYDAAENVELDSDLEMFFAKGTCVEVLRKDEAESEK